MKILKFACQLTMILNFIVAVYFFGHRTTNKQFLFMAIDGFAVALTLVAIITGIVLYFRGRPRPFLPGLICVIGLPAGLLIAGCLGGVLQDWRFRRDLPRYDAVIQLIEKGELKPSPQNSFIILPAEYGDLAWATIPAINDNGLSVAFMTETGFPVKHSGYLFVSSGTIETNANALQRWPYYSRINTNWFRISD